MKDKDHIHLLRRKKYKNGESIFFCIGDRCSFKCNTSLALGKRVLCNRCFQPFRMNEVSLRQAKPHCNSCTVKRKDGNAEVSNSISEGSTISTLDPVSDLRSRLVSTLESTARETPGVMEEDNPEDSDSML